MKIGKIKKKSIKPDVIPVTIPKTKPILAPDVFKKKKQPAYRPLLGGKALKGQ